MTTKVVCLQRKGGKVVQDCDVYIGRACNQGGWRLAQSKWRNPFTVKEAGSAAEAVRKYEEWLKTQDDLLSCLDELRGKTLGCWCKKKGTEPCHGDVLARMADRKRGHDDTDDESEAPCFSVVYSAYVHICMAGEEDDDRIRPFELHIPHVALQDFKMTGSCLRIALNQTPHGLDLPRPVKLKTLEDDACVLKIPFSSDIQVSASGSANETVFCVQLVR